MYNICGVTFTGVTKIYAVSDTHQETRKAAAFLTEILHNHEKNAVFLHGGDFFGGIYPKELERDCYIKMKVARPDLEMVLTIGNHDFGYDEKSFQFFLDTIKLFTAKGIKVVCSNIFDKLGKHINGIKPYTIIERDGDRTLVTGFCINDLKSRGQKFVSSMEQTNAIDDLIEAINAEKPDNLIILNHDFMDSSQRIINYCKSKGINVDLLIGGHDHRPVAPDVQNNIYYPSVFGKSMYLFELVNKNGSKELKNIAEISQKEHPKLDKLFQQIEDYENKAGVFTQISRRVLNLVHYYSDPCEYGSFFADSMKNAANSDIAFVSSGFIKNSLPYGKGKIITNYDFKRSMPTETPVKTVNLNIAELKEIFAHALKLRGFSEGNPRFLQSSSNIRIEGSKNFNLNQYEIKQIYVDGEALLDKFGNPVSGDRTFKCAVDSFISDGGQSFKTLQNKEKEIVYINGKPSKINEVLKNAIIDAQYKYKEGSIYPQFEIIDV